MFRLSAFRSDPASEVVNFIRTKRIELQTLAHEYQLDVPPGANKSDLHNIILDHLLDEGIIDSDSHDNYSIADWHALAAMKLKLELAKIEREQQKEALQQQKEALQIKKDEAAIKKEEQECEAALEKEALQRKEREVAIQREREREQLEARKRHLEMQREHDKKQAESILEYRRRELTLETTHHTQRQQATASLPTKKNPTTSDVRSRLTPTALYTG
ncbi:putative uncharacterized protein DDB_G0271982 [Procambarus clarkii]|uniref:putative uncharacterized protein DDB_G0271982 n=1 Tax=Procambarus clarkii TaxID=6728 RepID=UPI003742821A